MSSKVLTDCKIWFAEYDYSSRLNTVNLNHTKPALNDSRFGHGTEINKGSIWKDDLSVGGFGEEDTGGTNATHFARVGIANKPVTVCPEGNAAGDVAYSLLAYTGDMQTFGKYGVLNPFSGSAKSYGVPLIRGYLLAPITTSGTVSDTNGTAVQIGAIAAGQNLYIALHVFAISGTPSLSVTIESDNAQGFPSLAAHIDPLIATSASAQWTSIAGAVTDDWWRIKYAVTGGSPSVTFAVFAGLGPAA